MAGIKNKEASCMRHLERHDLPVLRSNTFFPSFFDDFLGKEDFMGLSKFTPAVDVAEEKDRYVVKADFPGMKQEDIRVEVDANTLTISGERKHEKEEKDDKKHYHYYERSYGSFERTFTLPHDADGDKIKAKVEHGVLTVDIPKSETKKAKEIKVE